MTDIPKTPVLVKRAGDREWTATGYAGIDRSLFRNNETGGRSSVVRLAQGARRHEMIEGACHCDVVRGCFDGVPESSRTCKCTVCRRYGVLCVRDYWFQ